MDERVVFGSIGGAMGSYGMGHGPRRGRAQHCLEACRLPARRDDRTSLVTKPREGDCNGTIGGWLNNAPSNAMASE